MSRFTLDEAKAREWLAAGIENFETGAEAGKLVLDPAYRPAKEYESGSDTVELVIEALHDGILVGPGQLVFDFSAGEDGGAYVWLLYLDVPAGHGLKLASGYEEIRHLGDVEDSRGTDAAMGVLREARDAGNRLLDDLAAYVTQEAGR